MAFPGLFRDFIKSKWGGGNIDLLSNKGYILYNHCTGKFHVPARVLPDPVDTEFAGERVPKYNDMSRKILQ
jgi:hypothetical protein